VMTRATVVPQVNKMFKIIVNLLIEE